MEKPVDGCVKPSKGPIVEETNFYYGTSRISRKGDAKNVSTCWKTSSRF